MKTKTLYYLAGGILTAVSGYFVLNLVKGNQRKIKVKRQKETSVGGNTVKDDEISSIGKKEGNDSYPLKVGSTGANVHVLQEALNSLGQNVDVDGKFGQQTYNAIREVSSGFGLLNFTCGIGYGCTLSYKNWQDIVEKAKSSGFNENASWTKAKRTWIINS